MVVKNKSKRVAEFGDFQTPLILAQMICGLLSQRKLKPNTILEPTCGSGAFLQAAAERFPCALKMFGFDINAFHVERAKEFVSLDDFHGMAEIWQGDFFTTDFVELFARCHEPILVLGNPPWVTNSELGTLGSSNLPAKSNFQRRAGFDAITGKANFDISEWMLIQLLDALNGRDATLAMLCKTTVARKTLFHAWKEGIAIRQSSLYSIDASRFFDASVDACLFVCTLFPGCHNDDCDLFDQLDAIRKSGAIGYRDGLVLADVDAYKRRKHLRGESVHRWRSGVKHDCSKVMELSAEGKVFRNGLGEIVELETEYLYPMLKTSEVANGSTQAPRHWMIVTQNTTGEDTAAIQAKAPKTWQYLLDHAGALDARGSSIYRNRPRFSIFGIGEYVFAPWKVAISGFYKRLGFTVIGPYKGRPVVLDDASYFLACQSEEEARLLHCLLTSETAKDFFSAFVFWDAKRPITVEVLQQLDLLNLAKELGMAHQLNGIRTPKPHHKQQRLFSKTASCREVP
jgi:hypothetical protein